MEQIIKTLLSFFNIDDAEIEINDIDENLLNINIKTENGKTLIGPHGNTLKDLELILRLLASKNNINKKVILDINGYRKFREEQLKKLAKETAHKVMITKNPIKLPPMNAYERRIIHMELAINPNVTTESVGEEPERCLIVKPYP
ncbi:MAG: protein jag [Patescibacteria group bacterium]